MGQGWKAEDVAKMSFEDIAAEMTGKENRRIQISNELLAEKAETKRLAAQIAKLAAFILQNIPGEPSRDEGAVDTAIRLLSLRSESPVGGKVGL